MGIKRSVSIVVVLGVFVLFIMLMLQCQPSKYATNESRNPLIKIEPTQIYGYDKDIYCFDSLYLEPNQFLSDLLLNNDVTYQDIALIEQKAIDIYSVRKIRADRQLVLVKNRSCDQTISLIYEPDPFSYVVYNFKDSIDVHIEKKDSYTKVETATGTIETSLWNAMIDKNINPVLIDKMADALEWSVDFYHTQKGDQFKLIYETTYVEGEPKGIGKLLGAYYKNNLDNYAIYFETEKYNGFYDKEGRPSKKAFLKSPVKFSRISSRYNKKRFHPILKRRKAHLGTDYAAGYGTPIRSVGNGVVIKAAYKKNNGRYVKIKHDKTYETQYLHMQKFGPGIRVGTHVKQGQTIGYVGSTGMATGPHVCFRFWKNGRQVDHLRENFPPPKPMNDEYLPEFFKIRDKVTNILEQLEYEPLMYPNAYLLTLDTLNS